MKRINLLFFALLSFFSAVAQTGEDFNPADLNHGNTTSLQNIESDSIFDIQKAKKMSFGIEFGTGIESYMHNSTAFYTYTAPSFRYALSKKFSVRVGVMMMNVNANNLYYYNTEGIQKANGNLLQTYFYTAADYYATERLRLTGEILYGNSILQNSGAGFGNKPKAFSIGAEYKISDNFQIGIKIGQGQNEQGFFVPGFGF